jgi:orotate phosphoribosyltransferase
MDICDNLANMLRKCKVVKFGEFHLASGKKSNYYIDIKRACTDPKTLKLITHCMTKMMMIHGINTDYIACIEMGGVQIGTAISLETDKPLIIVRKQEKDHGIKDVLIGNFKKGKTVTLVEDVVTTGGSIIRAAQILRDKGLSVYDVISVVDRKERSDILTNECLMLRSIVKLEELVNRNKMEEK